MAFFIGFLSVYLLLWLASLLFGGALADAHLRGALAAAAMFLFTGIFHFAKQEKMEAMVPPRWPYRRLMNHASGAAEIILGRAGIYANPSFVSYRAACTARGSISR